MRRDVGEVEASHTYVRLLRNQLASRTDTSKILVTVSLTLVQPRFLPIAVCGFHFSRRPVRRLRPAHHDGLV